MFRFTIRDVLWLMVVVSLSLGWYRGATVWQSERSELKARLAGQARQIKGQENRLTMLQIMLDSAKKEKALRQMPFTASDPVRRW